jgi:hypothetical protein
MKWAVASLLTFCMLCAPAVLQAQEDPLTINAAKALQDFAQNLERACFPDFKDWPRSRRIRIAVAQMEYGSGFTKERTEEITDTIERLLGKDTSSFEILPRRQGARLDEIMKNLAQGGPPVLPGFQPGLPPDVVISIEARQDSRGRPALSMFAFRVGKACQHSVGPFFADASQRVSEEEAERKRIAEGEEAARQQRIAKAEEAARQRIAEAEEAARQRIAEEAARQRRIAEAEEAARQETGRTSNLPPSGPTPIVAQRKGSYWDFEGSILHLEGLPANGPRVLSVYRPNGVMSAMGAHSGDLFFTGQRIGNKYKGTAYEFAGTCGNFPYLVEGNVLNDTIVVLSGMKPTINRSNCRIIGTTSTELELTYKYRVD